MSRTTKPNSRLNVLKSLTSTSSRHISPACPLPYAKLHRVRYQEDRVLTLYCKDFTYDKHYTFHTAIYSVRERGDR